MYSIHVFSKVHLNWFPGKAFKCILASRSLTLAFFIRFQINVDVCSGSLSCWITQLCSSFNRLTVDFCGKVEEFGGSHASLFRPLYHYHWHQNRLVHVGSCKFQLDCKVSILQQGLLVSTLSVHVDVKPTSLYTVMLDNQQFSVQA